MPTNKRESLIFMVSMCFCMVLWMSIYNVARSAGVVNMDVVSQAWLGFPVAYVFAMICDHFIASPLAMKAAFKFIVRPNSSPRVVTVAVSSCMVVPMVVIMSLFGVFEGATHMPGGIAAVLPSVPMLWLQNIGWNFIMALPFNLLVAGPIVRALFRRAFPIGTVLEKPVENDEPTAAPARVSQEANAQLA